MRIYYKIWVDGILKVRSAKENKNSWKYGLMLLMSVAMGMNIALFMTILQKHILGFYFYELHFSFLPHILSNLFSGIILFLAPPLILNYLFIFYRGRYKELIKKYRSHGGKLFQSYFLVSLFLPIVLLWGVILFQFIRK